MKDGKKVVICGIEMSKISVNDLQDLMYKFLRIYNEAVVQRGVTVRALTLIRYVSGYQVAHDTVGSTSYFGQNLYNLLFEAVMVDHINDFGVYYDEDESTWVLDTQSIHYTDLDAAMQAARANGQDSIYDWANDKVIPVKSEVSAGDHTLLLTLMDILSRYDTDDNYVAKYIEVPKKLTEVYFCETVFAVVSDLSDLCDDSSRFRRIALQREIQLKIPLDYLSERVGKYYMDNVSTVEGNYFRQLLTYLSPVTHMIYTDLGNFIEAVDTLAGQYGIEAEYVATAVLGMSGTGWESICDGYKKIMKYDDKA